MKKNPHAASRLLICAGTLMTVSGVLMAFCVGPAYGGIMWAAASCFFCSARSLRLAENKKCELEESDDEQTAL